jgi:RNA ligase (TIGR02306 family)
MERKLASVRRITNLSPIDGADKIELATVDGWKVVVAKDVGHKIGDLIIYCEIDSFLPIKEEFEFLRKSSYKKMSDGTEGFRLKTIRLRGQISQGLIIPISVLNPPDTNIYVEPFEGLDVTEMLGIVKYEPPIPAELAGKVKGLFPSFIPKTDEERVQNYSDRYQEWTLQSKHQFYVTEKLDGSSSTFYYNNGEFGVCSRNLELLETEGNTFWKVARELDLENKFKSLGRNLALQG